jgi:lipopolysaccharide export system protein LptC
MMRRAILLLLVLIIVGLFAWLAPRRAVEVAIGASAEPAPEEPGYIALDAQLTTTGLPGRCREFLAAAGDSR